MRPLIRIANRQNRLRIALRLRQRGFSLFIVFIILLLSVLLVIGGARVSVLLEAMTGSRREYDRAFEAAEAGLLDAQRDIDRLFYSSTSKTYEHCVGASVSTDVCRSTPGLRAYPDVDTNGLAAYEQDTCKDGICIFASSLGVSGIPSPAVQFWTNVTYRAASMPATFGQFTGAPIPTEGREALLNTKYWIEVIARPTSSKTGAFIYRITALSTGTQAVDNGTQVVLQANYDPDPVV